MTYPPAKSFSRNQLDLCTGIHARFEIQSIAVLFTCFIFTYIFIHVIIFHFCYSCLLSLLSLLITSTFIIIIAFVYKPLKPATIYDFTQALPLDTTTAIEARHS